MLVMHPKVVDVAVFGVPNDDFGEEVKAVVQPVAMPASADDAESLAKELITFCRSQLADVNARARSTFARNCRDIQRASSTSAC